MAQGHSLQDIVWVRQPGVPYPGWTWPQYVFWTRIADRRRRWATADLQENIERPLALVVASNLHGGKVAAEAWKNYEHDLGRLRS